ncbi:hypothetical protein DFP72DRAFT_925965 [Ephemerocybe angulata]|uniref:Uncharacterized protein n=1 Tax=Ephemerocybe angulata TaxID=980116 RepID=A0A8H6HET9_9AGAR|nr:hypothetical protein DFP72DRAFT_925965 [Tulosesus angulatus]
MSTASGHTASSVERPERSRNAKAQAGIVQRERLTLNRYLEQTVTKLQAALGYSPEQVSALPPSSITIRELQQDNMRLQKEIEDLRRALADAGGGQPTGEPRSPLSHHYGNIPSHNGSQNAAPNSMFNLHGPAFQMPNTPSGSSATSSPPFSPIQMQANVSTTHYGSSVKVEDDSYSSSNQHSSSMHYSYSNQPHDMDWHYSSERAHLHR